MRIVFMGTPEFSVPSLNALISRGDDVAAVVTQPDRERGRGQKVLPSPVKTVALEHGIPVLQFPRIKAPEGVAALRKLAPDLIVTAAFGKYCPRKFSTLRKWDASMYTLRCCRNTGARRPSNGS
jgi:methionyl-tRNA formyltransferase